MASNLSNGLTPLNVDNDEQVRLPTSATTRRHFGKGQHHRHHIHTKRAVTLDSDTNEEKLRIVVLGATKVGKTCLCQQFLQDKFVNDHKETLDEMHSIELSLVDRHLMLEILDTAGIDEFPVMRRIAIAHGDAFLIVYAVNDAHSFDIAREMYQLVLEIKTDSSKSIPVVIVANKSDVEIEKREITQEYAESIVRDQWKTTLIETTCHERESVLNAFRILLNLANINITFIPDVIRRSSDPSLSSNKPQRTTNKRQSCAQQ